MGDFPSDEQGATASAATAIGDSSGTDAVSTLPSPRSTNRPSRLLQPISPSSSTRGHTHNGALVLHVRAKPSTDERKEQPDEVEMANTDTAKRVPHSSTDNAAPKLALPSKAAAAAASSSAASVDSSSSSASSSFSSLSPALVAHSRPGDRLFATHNGIKAFPTLPSSSSTAAAVSSSPPSSASPTPPSVPSYASSTNAVISSKYTVLTFLPINLFEQFHNVANLYFLLVGILQAIKSISTTNGIPTMYEPLAFIVFISSLRAAKEDYDKHASDAKRNGYLFDVLREQGWVECRSGDVRVGDLLRIKEGDMVPADCLLINSSHSKGHCFIDKANLNGETRLEVMNSVPTTRHLTDSDALLATSLTLTYEQPNKAFDSFRGYLSAATATDVREGGVDGKALLMRETILRNTDWIIGLVVYTGDDTKIQRSNLDGEKPKLKVSRIMRQVDQLLKCMLAIQVALCLLGGILAGVYHSQLGKHWYLSTTSSDDYSSPLTGVLAFFSWFILLSSMVPISLIVSAELVKFTQSVFIQWDVRMYSSQLNKPAKCNSSTIHEDLGIIDYVFSDKTGTLTQNRMEFRYAMLTDGSRGGDEEYGSKETDIAKSVKVRQQQLAEEGDNDWVGPDSGKRARGKRRREGKTWTEMERVHYPRRDERDRMSGCCGRHFPGFMRACWEGRPEEEAIVDEEQSQKLPGAQAGQQMAAVRPISPGQISAHSQALHNRSFPRTAISPPTPSVISPASTLHLPAAPTASLPAALHSPPASQSDTFTDGERDVLLSALWGPNTSTAHKRRLYRYLQHMALSNTVKPYEEDGQLRFQSESAEELAMVQFAHRMGFTKRSINPTVLEVDCYRVEDGRRERKEVRVEVYNHVATFGFTSKRARVSLIYQRISMKEKERLDREKKRDDGQAEAKAASAAAPKSPSALSPSGSDGSSEHRDERVRVSSDDADKVSSPVRPHIPLLDTSQAESTSLPIAVPDDEHPILVMTKGQDTVILPFLSLDGINEAALLLSLKDMSTNGLRTLVCGHASLPLSWWTSRQGRYQEAIGREQSVASEAHPDKCRKADGGCEKCLQHDLFDEMEVDARLSYCGTLGLEDKLQPLVPECIADCLRGGIKVWMITGDKLETAKNIGVACNLIDADMMPQLSADTDLNTLVQACSNNRLLEITGQWADLAQNEEEVGKLFDSLDVDGHGVIVHEQLIMVLRTLRCSIPEEKLRSFSNGAPGIGRDTFVRLMQSTRLSEYEAVKYDIDSAIRTYNSITDHSLYPVSILVDRTAFQVMFPGQKKRQKKLAVDESTASTQPAVDQPATPTSTAGTTLPSPAASAQSPAADELELLRAKFFELARRSKSVVFARAEPSMKQRMVTEIQARVPSAITLAIGDGANDCVAEDTPVQLADGRGTKLAREVVLGDRLLGTGGRAAVVTGEPFTRPEARMYRVTAATGVTFVASPGHLVTLAWRRSTCVTVTELEYKTVLVTTWRSDTLQHVQQGFRFLLRDDPALGAGGKTYVVYASYEQALAAYKAWTVFNNPHGGYVKLSFNEAKGRIFVSVYEGQTSGSRKLLGKCFSWAIPGRAWMPEPIIVDSVQEARDYAWAWYNTTFPASTDDDEFTTTTATPIDSAEEEPTTPIAPNEDDEDEDESDDEQHKNTTHKTHLPDTLPHAYKHWSVERTWRPLKHGDLVEVRAEHLAKPNIIQQLGGTSAATARAVLVLSPVSLASSPSAVTPAVGKVEADELTRLAVNEENATRQSFSQLVSVVHEPTVTSCTGWQVDGDGRFVLGNGILTHNCMMIKEAHIGVGIAGVEGTAATNSADYAIGSFRMLHTLLFVHGYWSYQRQTKLVNFIFYKASLVALAMYIFGFFSAFSGQQFIDDPIYELYNVIYTALPVLVLSVLDQPLPADTLQNNPLIYKLSKQNGFRASNFFTWIGRSFVHALVIFFVAYAQIAMMDVNRLDGRNDGIWFFSSVVYMCVVLTPTLLVLFEMSYITLLHVGAVLLSVVALVLIDYIINSPLIFSIDTNLNTVINVVYSCPAAWLTILLTVAVLLLAECVLRGWQREWRPTVTQVYQERRRMADEKRRRGAVAEESRADQDDSSEEQQGRAARRGSVMHVPIDISAERRGEADGGVSGGHNAELLKQNVVKAMLRMRNQMGAQFDSAAQAALQQHDRCELVESVNVRSAAGGGGSGGGGKGSTRRYGNVKSLSGSRSHHSHDASTSHANTARQQQQHQSHSELPWQVNSSATSPVTDVERLAVS